MCYFIFFFVFLNSVFKIWCICYTHSIYQFGLTTFHLLKVNMWLVATLMDSSGSDTIVFKCFKVILLRIFSVMKSHEKVPSFFYF